jgi:hypothetical protein
VSVTPLGGSWTIPTTISESEAIDIRLSITSQAKVFGQYTSTYIDNIQIQN